MYPLCRRPFSLEGVDFRPELFRVARFNTVVAARRVVSPSLGFSRWLDSTLRSFFSGSRVVKLPLRLSLVVRGFASLFAGRKANHDIFLHFLFPR